MPTIKALRNESHADKAKGISIGAPTPLDDMVNLGASESIPYDAELAVIVKAWPSLPEDIRQAILRLIKSGTE